MATDWRSSEKRNGLGILFSLLALGGALLMYLEAGDPLAGWGFALAMAAASVAVFGLHLG